jgi:3-dehydroquinate dehydratase-2
MKRLLVINGPNLNLLGQREENIYGSETLANIARKLDAEAQRLNMEMKFIQSNHEGEIIDSIHKAKGKFDVIIINPGAYTHYSIAIRDAIKAIKIPAIEVHISNIYSREEFRAKSVIAPVCMGQISGFGWKSYLLAINAAALL